MLSGKTQIPVSYFAESDKNNGLSMDECKKRMRLYGHNLIDVKLKPILVLLFTEVLSPFYIFQVASMTVWYTDGYYYYATVVVLMSLISIVLDVWQTRFVSDYWFYNILS